MQGAVGALGEVHGEVETGDPAAGGDRPDREAGQVGAVGALPGGQVEHHLEERGGGQVAFGLQLVGDPVERGVLVVEGVQDGGAVAGEQLAEVRVALPAAAQHEAVVGVAGHPLEFGAGAAGDGGADADVLLAGVAAQQCLVGAEQDHEEGGALLFGEGAQPGGGGGGHVELGDGAGPAAYGGPGPVGGQAERFGAGELSAPPVEGGLGGGAALAGVHPGRVVGVLDGRFGQYAVQRAGDGARGPVAGGQVGEEQRPGQRVAGDVVHDHDQDVVVGGQAQQPHPQRGLGGQVEDLGGAGPDEGGRGGVPVALGDSGDLGDGVVDGAGRVDGLAGFCAVEEVAGAQDLVAGGQRVEGAAQGVLVEGAAQPVGERQQVLGAVRVELVQEPQLALAGGERQRCPRSARGIPVRAGTPAARPARPASRLRSSSARSSSCVGAVGAVTAGTPCGRWRVRRGRGSRSRGGRPLRRLRRARRRWGVRRRRAAASRRRTPRGGGR